MTTTTNVFDSWFTNNCVYPFKILNYTNGPDERFKHHWDVGLITCAQADADGFEWLLRATTHTRDPSAWNQCVRARVQRIPIDTSNATLGTTLVSLPVSLKGLTKQGGKNPPMRRKVNTGTGKVQKCLFYFILYIVL